MHARLSCRRTLVLLGATTLAIVGGLLLVLGISRQQPAPPRADSGSRPVAGSSADPSSTAGAAPAPADPQDGRGHAPALPASKPVRVTIPALKVSSSLESLGLDGQDAMETPRDPAKAGWYRPGPEPGAMGPAIIAGHVTWNGTPAVFFRLGALDPGDTIRVDRRDGRTAEFTVDRVATYDKKNFPTVEVYRNLDYAGLRLITCGGDYSEADHRYAANVVVYATLTGSRR